MKTFVETTASTEVGRRRLNQERAVIDLMELICELMEKDGVTRSDLAIRLGRTRGAISQFFNGRPNVTLCTVSDVFTALGYTMQFRVVKD